MITNRLTEVEERPVYNTTELVDSLYGVTMTQKAYIDVQEEVIAGLLLVTTSYDLSEDTCRKALRSSVYYTMELGAKLNKCNEDKVREIKSHR